MKIPWQALSDEALCHLLEEFVTRDGTDYGKVETELTVRVGRVFEEIRSGRAEIHFDPESGTTMIAVSGQSPARDVRN